MPAYKMTIDYQTEMSTVLTDYNAIPSWFYNLSSGDINTIVSSALSNYTSATEAKNNTFIAFWEDLLIPYTP